MDPRRAPYHVPPDPALPPIPPSSMPSLSSGQGFYTVESLQGATVVPPPQLLPPPPRLLHPPEFFLRDRFDPPRRILPQGPPFRLPNRPLPPLRGPPLDVGPALRGGPALRQPPPPFGADSRIPGFHAGRDPRTGRERGWRPHRDAGTGRERDRAMQRPGVRKQVHTSKPVPQLKAPLPAGALDEKSSAGKQSATEEGPGWCSMCKINCYTAETLRKHLAGKRHKRQLEEVNVEGEETKRLEGEDQGMNKADEEATRPVKEEANEAAKEGEGSEQVDAAATFKESTTVPSKKRANSDKEGALPNRKCRKSAVPAHAQNVTVVNTEEKEDKTAEDENSRKTEKASDALEVCELCNVTCTSKSMLESHFKGKKHAGRLKKAINKSSVDMEVVKEGGGLVNSTGDLANGNAGQFAEVQQRMPES